MLPQSHIAYTLAAFDLLKNYLPAFKNVDLRWVTIAALGPDLIDKPLAAMYFYRRYRAAVLFAHTLIVHGVILAFTLRKKPEGWPYALAFNGHALLDRLWLFHDTWYWPFRGWRFQVWGKPGANHLPIDQTEMRLAYWHTFIKRPQLWGWEVGGLLVGLWFVWRHQLYRPARLLALLRTGKINEEVG